MSIPQQLENIIKKYHADYENKKDMSCVQKANAKFPIVWFGNIEKYLNSSVKILTIGQNPSDKEFAVPRFDNAELGFTYKSYITVMNSLNKYFDINPYKWFDAFERVLYGMKLDASYGGKISKNFTAKNTVINVDFFSAIATNPTWSELKDFEKDSLKNISLFTELYGFLAPNIVLFSTAKDYIRSYFNLNKNLLIFNIDIVLEIYKRNNTIFIWGKPIQIPFNGVPNEILNKDFKMIVPEIAELYK